MLMMALLVLIWHNLQIDNIWLVLGCLHFVYVIITLFYKVFLSPISSDGMNSGDSLSKVWEDGRVSGTQDMTKLIGGDNVKLLEKNWNMLTSSNGNIFALLAICAGNSPVIGEFHAQRPVTRSFDAFFDLRLNKQFNKQSWGWWFESLSRSLWRHCNGCVVYLYILKDIIRESLTIRVSWHGLTRQRYHGGCRWHSNLNASATILERVSSRLCYAISAFPLNR